MLDPNPTCCKTARPNNHWIPPPPFDGESETPLQKKLIYSFRGQSWNAPPTYLYKEREKGSEWLLEKCGAFFGLLLLILLSPAV